MTRRLLGWVALGCAAACAHAPTTPRLEPARHVRDPLEADEIRAAARAVRGDARFGEGSVFASLALHEPVKSALRGDEAPAREALAVILDRRANATYEALVDLDAGEVVSWRHVPGVQPMLVDSDYEIAERLVRADPRWQAALRKRGITKFDKVHLDPWAAGEAAVPGAEGARILRAIAFWRGDQRNPYGPPIEGVVATVDVTHGRVLEVSDPPAVPIARESTEFEPRARRSPTSRTGTPAQRTFEVRGHEIRWENWRFRWSFHPREGLVLHDIGWAERGIVRSILHRASVAEMWVPYGDPDAGWSWRNAFDAGEYGLGTCAAELAPGSGAPEDALVLDAVLADEHGEPAVLAGAVAVYERDGGMLWGHADFAGGAPRARELAIGFVATIGNYDYGCRWVFHQDGRIAFDTDLTGILLTKGVHARACGACRAPPNESGTAVPSAEERHGVLLAPNLLAPHHQHFLSLRLDLDVDGTSNSVREIGVRSDPDDPSGAGFVAIPTILGRESAAQRDLSMGENRCWEIFNPSASNSAGHASGYTLLPGRNAVPYRKPSDPTRTVAGFAGHHVWVTRWKAEELYAAGDYPMQAREAGGLPAYAADDEPIEDADVVLWYTLGFTHVARSEEFPVMPVAHAGFELVPSGFFDRNPSLR